MPQKTTTCKRLHRSDDEIQEDDLEDMTHKTLSFIGRWNPTRQRPTRLFTLDSNFGKWLQHGEFRLWTLCLIRPVRAQKNGSLNDTDWDCIGQSILLYTCTAAAHSDTPLGPKMESTKRIESLHHSSTPFQLYSTNHDQPGQFLLLLRLSIDNNDTDNNDRRVWMAPANNSTP